jgi:hypothetical protein
MRYLPIIDHLKHMFSNGREAQPLFWHVQRKRDGNIQHSVDGRQWKHFDLSHEDFSNDPSNIRFGPSTNEMNSFREMRNPHSTWPIIMCIYNCNTHFFLRIKFCANRSAYKNAYQIIVYMKTFQKNKSCIGCIAWHGILYFSKILEEPRRI